MKGELENHSKGPVIPLELMIEYHPVSAADRSRLIKMEGKFYLVYALDMHCMRAESGKETAWSRTWRSWRNLDASDLHAPRLNATEVIMSKNCQKTSYSRSQMEQSSCLEQIRFSKDPLQFGTTLHERAQRCKENRTGLNHWTNQRMTMKPGTIFWSIEGNNILSSPWVQLLCGKKNHYLNHCWNVDVVRRTNTSVDILLEKPYGCVLERWQWPGSIGTIDPFHAVHLFSMKNRQTDTSGPDRRLTTIQATSRPDHSLARD